MSTPSLFDASTTGSWSQPPAYSLDPSVQERTLELTPRSTRNTSDSDTTYTKKSGTVAVELKSRKTHSGQPCYGQNSLVEGTVFISRVSDVRQVSVELRGQLKTTVKESSATTVNLIRDTHTLWDDSSAKDSCPPSMSFSLLFPREFEHGGSTIPLPPSYELYMRGQDGCTVSCEYSVIVNVSYKSSRLMSWLNKKKLVVPVFFYPKSRPSRPMGTCSDLKGQPEDWYQALAEFKSRSDKVSSLYCSAFLPDGRVYGLSDVVPIHLHLSGPMESLELLTPFAQKNSDIKPSISLLRQVTVESGDIKTIHTQFIGSGDVKPVPPSVFSTGEDLDWEGDLHCLPDIPTVAFNAPGVTIKDFISISFPSMSSQKSPFKPVHIAVPIKLTTESWHDGGGG